MTNRREFIKSGVAAGALIASPAILRAQTREPFVMMTPFGFIADFIEMMNAISGGYDGSIKEVPGGYFLASWITYS